MRKRARFHIRLPEPDAELVSSAARRLDFSLSEFVRRVTVSAAVEVLRGGSVPPPTPNVGQADGRSAVAG